MKDWVIIVLASALFGLFLAAIVDGSMKQYAIDIGYFENHGQFYRVTKMDAPK